ncbi:PASTA domain-containing protein, partial [Streptomyces nigra]
KKSNTSTILLAVAAVLVLVGAILIGKWVFDGNTASNDSVAVPSLIGESRESAKELLANVDLKLGEVKQDECENQPKGKICSQSPDSKEEVDKGSAIDVVVSTGAPKVTVPSVIGISLEDAREKLEGDDFQFTIKTETREVSAEEPGTVLDQDPQRGEEVEKGSTITLTVAKEQVQSTVPDVVGRTCDEAKAQMQDSDLTGNCTEVETQDPNQVGKVISTSPTAGSKVDKNSTVTIQIGKQAEQKAQVPNVVGQTVAQAKQTLQQAGFTNIQFENGSDQNDNALVVRQDPNAGRPADPANTPVKLTTVGFGGGDNNGGGNNGGPFG